MLHLSLSLMSRLNKTESAVFELWLLYFENTPHPINYMDVYNLYYFLNIDCMYLPELPV